MKLPISYNVRNLVVRKTTTIMTALGVALTVAVLLADLALVNGLREAFASSADPRNVLVLRKGGTSELNSAATRQQFQDIKFKPGIARNEKGDPMASLEIITVVSLKSSDFGQSSNLTLRGLTEAGVQLRSVRISEGRWFAQGQREIVVGAGTAKRYPDARLGKRLKFGKGYWTVAGIMDAGRGAANSEIWADLNQAASDFNRENGLSSVLVRAADEASVSALVNSISDDQKLNMVARTEGEYYESQTVSALPIQFLGIFVSVIMAVGSSFAAMNTMYAAVARRAKEIGTLRILGFSRGTILLSFLIESLVLSALGGILGCLLVLPLNNVTTGIGSFITFSEISFNFNVSPTIMGAGVVFALFMGAIGGVFPARSAAKKEILTALREI
jgi:putative ABC transport system permease protein